MRYLWLRDGQPFAILIFESSEGKELLISLDCYGNRFDFVGALAVKMHKKYPSRFPSLLDEFGNRHLFWDRGNYFEILVLYDVLGIPCEYDIESLDLPVYVL